MEPAIKGDLFVMYSQNKRSYTTADIEALPESSRAELIDGRMYAMAAPTLEHQDILMWLSALIFNYIKAHGGKCKVLPAPFGVFIKKDDRNYFEPDISVICDRGKLDQKGCHGAPDWIIEIASPSSRRMDYHLKPLIYAESGVQEYWIVDYEMRKVSVYSFQKSAVLCEYRFCDTVKAGIYEDFMIDFTQLPSH